MVEKGIIVDACVHRSFQDRKRMPYWSRNQVKSSENNADPTSSADESMGLRLQLIQMPLLCCWP